MQFPISLTVLAYLLIACDAIHSHHGNSQQAARDDWDHVLSPRVETGMGDGMTTSRFKIGKSCSDKTSTIDAWLGEIIVLHNSLLRAYRTMDSGNNIALITLFWEIFGIFPNASGGRDKTSKPSNIRWAAIRSRLAQVNKFLGGGGLTNPAAQGQTPWLFCSADDAKFVPWEQPVRDKKGENVRLDPDSGYLTVKDVFSKYNKDGKRPFFLQELNGYVFSEKGVNDPCDQGLGGYTANNAQTPDYSVIGRAATPIELAEFQTHILICPATFKPTTASHSAVTLAQAVTAANYPNGDTGNDAEYRLDKFLPMSATLYHELYHLADAELTTGDPYYSMESIFKAGMATYNANVGTGKAPDDPTTNPESYVFLAMAAYMYFNPPEGMTPVSFRVGLPRTSAQILAEITAHFGAGAGAG